MCVKTSFSMVNVDWIFQTLLDGVSESLTYQLTNFFLNFFLNTVINFAFWIKRNFEVSTSDIPDIFRFMNVVVVVEILLSAVLYDVFVSAPVSIFKLVPVLSIFRAFLVSFTALRACLLADIAYYRVALTIFIDCLVTLFIVSLILFFLVSV